MSDKNSPPPDFYTGAPLEPDDLWFRDEFIQDLQKSLCNEHVILSAPRRTGKTSIMDYLVEHPPTDFAPLSVFVQDITHPADFILLLLDLFQEKYPKRFKEMFEGTKSWIGKALGKVNEIDVQGFKITLREQEDNWDDEWKKYGDEFFAQARKDKHRLLLLVDEFPDMILNISKQHPELVLPFLSWFRGHRLKPRPKLDPVRWLLCGSVNLSSTLDMLGCLDKINDLQDIPLPPLDESEVIEFVHEMLVGRGVEMDEKVPGLVAEELGRPVPIFLQMVTQDLYRNWKKHQKQLDATDVTQAFSDLVVTSGARDKLQHYYSRIDQYYQPPKRAAAYSLLAKISISPKPTERDLLYAEFVRILIGEGDVSPADKRKQLFNQLMRDLENDFYVVEMEGESFDFASGLVKRWWRKYYA